MQPYISLCMIVKNEESVIERCLKTVKDIVDEIIIVDTGSTDKTMKIVNDFTDKVFYFEWTDSFADARNYAASKATGKWILTLDADEFVDSNNLSEVIEKLKNEEDTKDAYAVRIYNFVGGFGEQIVQHKSLRLYKNEPDIKYYRAIHEQIGRSDGSLTSGDIDLVVYHSGYLSKTIVEKNKSDRNTPLVHKELEKSENKGFDYFNLGNELFSIGKIEEALDAFKKSYINKPAFGYGWVGITVVQIINCLIQLNRFKEALEVVADSEKIWTTTADFKCMKANIYFQQHRYDDSAEELLDVLKKPDFYTNFIMSIDFGELYPHIMLGKIYALMKDYQKSFHHFSNALNINRTHTEVIASILTILSENNSDEDIKSIIEKYEWLEIPVIRLHVIRVLQSLGKSELCMEIIEAVEEGSIKRGFLLKNQMIRNNWSNALTLIMKEDVQSLNIMLNQGCYDFYDLLLIGLNQEDNKFLEFISKIVNPEEKEFINFVIGNAETYKDSERYIKLLQKTIRLQQFEIFEKLLSKKGLFSEDLNNSIGNLLYESGFKDLAVDFYLEVESTLLNNSACVYIAESFIEKELLEDALNFSLSSLQSNKDDYRLIKFTIELLEKQGRLNDRDEIINSALSIYPDSHWLKDKLIFS